MTAKRYRGFGQRLGVSLIASLVMGAWATTAEAQVQFSAWPLCTNVENPVGLASSAFDTAGELAGLGIFQPVPAKADNWELATVCTGASFNIPGGGEIADGDLPTSAWVIGYLGAPPIIGTSPGIPSFFLPVSISPLTAPDTGRTSPAGTSIRRICATIPTQIIPAGEILSIALVANIDPVIGGMGIHESDLVDASVHDSWALDFSPDQNIFDGFTNNCDDIAAYELFGPNPIPTVSEWGLVAMTLLMMTAGTLVFRSRMAQPVTK